MESGVGVAVTIRDVAKAAGVSIATVSRALSKPGQVAEETRLHVLKNARELGYHPNTAARGLSSGRTGSIGLVVPDLENPYFGSVAKGVQERARAQGYSVLIADSDEDAGLEAEIVRTLARQVDGIILCSARGTEATIRSLSRDIRVVLVNRHVEGLPSISGDNAGGMRQLVGHLVALGHRSIAYAGGPATSWTNKVRGDALAEILAANAELDLVDLGNFPPSYSGGMQAGDVALASRATATITFNDLMAVGLLERLRQRGASVPADMSVAGFDNIPAAAMAWPGLTTVDCPRVHMGRAGVDLLLDAVLGRDAGSEPDVGAELIIRPSTGPAPEGAAAR